MNVIRYIIDQGTANEHNVVLKKHIRFANSISLILGVFVLQNVVVSAYYHVVPLTTVRLLHIMGIALVPVLNHYGHRLAASLWFSILAIFFVTLYSIIYPLDTNAIFYLPLSIFLVFLYPTAERKYVFIFLPIIAACFAVAYLWHYYKLPALFYMPTEVSDAQRSSTFIGVPLLSILFGLYAFFTINKAESETEKEREKTERLLLNILPRHVAERFKDDQSFLAQRFNSVTVLFADIVGFTKMSEKLEPDAIVAFLNTLFSEFDHLIDQYGQEKIKTIGDSYMVAGGVPVPSKDHTTTMCKVALGMQQIVTGFETPTGDHLRIRIGIHTGPAIAGVIGEKKFIYDLWGDTVNTASRMESHAENGTIQITKEVYEMVKEDYQCIPRGIVNVKDKGPMSTYLLLGEVKEKESLSLLDQYIKT